VTFLHAQEKQKIPVEFFTGKWAGTISGYAHGHNHDKQGYSRTINFSIDLISSGGLGGEAIIKPYGIKGVRNLMFLGGVAPNVPVVEKGKTYYLSPFVVHFSFDFTESELVTPGTDQNILATYFLGLVDFKMSNNRIDMNNNTIFIGHKQTERCYECSRPAIAFVYNGEIYKMDEKKLIFPKDIKPNEPIKTDKKTQLEITMPSKDVIKVAQNTETVIRSESLMEVVKGKIHGLIKKLKPQTKFDVKTPTSVIGVRGTEYEINVEYDGTTTVVVLDGEIEFSDKENKKIIIVKKNKTSVCKPNGLPFDPNAINKDQLLKWWK
jgi:hypothetical protein